MLSSLGVHPHPIRRWVYRDTTNDHPEGDTPGIGIITPGSMSGMSVTSLLIKRSRTVWRNLLPWDQMPWLAVFILFGSVVGRCRSANSILPSASQEA